MAVRRHSMQASRSLQIQMDSPDLRRSLMNSMSMQKDSRRIQNSISMLPKSSAEAGGDMHPDEDRFKFRLDPQDLLIPTESGKFGTQAFEAKLRHKGILKPVSVKRLPIGRDNIGLEYVWLQHEMQQKLDALMAAVSACSQMCRIHGHCIKGKELYVVTKMYQTSLADVIVTHARPGTGLSLVETCHIGLRIAAGLLSLHASGIQHWDLTPSNVLFDEHGNALISACGIERRIQAMLPHVALSESPEESAHVMKYGAPETVAGGSRESVLGWAADMWSLAAITSHMLTGVAPYKDLDTRHLLVSHSVHRKPPLLPLAEDTPAELLQFLKDCFSFTPLKRPRAAAAVEVFLNALKHSASAVDSMETIIVPAQDQTAARVKAEALAAITDAQSPFAALAATGIASSNTDVSMDSPVSDQTAFNMEEAHHAADDQDEIEEIAAMHTEGEVGSETLSAHVAEGVEERPMSTTSKTDVQIGVPSAGTEFERASMNETLQEAVLVANAPINKATFMDRIQSPATIAGQKVAVGEEEGDRLAQQDTGARRNSKRRLTSKWHP